MIKNIMDFVAGISNREFNRESSIYAQILKNERIKRKMTLETMAKDICSVSYLCKLENSLVKRNDCFVKALFEKVNLNFDRISTDLTEELCDEILKAVFLRREDEVERLFDKVDGLPFSSSSEIIKCFYYLQKRDFEKYKEEFKLLEKIKFTLAETEAITLLYLVILYYMSIYDFKKAYEYLTLLDILNIENKELKYLVSEANLYTAFHLKNYKRFFLVYNQYEKITDSGYPTGRRIINKMLYNVVISSEYLGYVLDDVNSINLEDIPQTYKLDIMYYLLQIKMIKGDKKELFWEIINNTFYYDSRFLGLLAVICYLENDEELYKRLLELAEKYHFLEEDSIHQRFVFFVLLYKTSGSNNDFLRYIKEEIISKLDNESYPIYDDIYKEIYLRLLLSTSKYKESFYFLEKFIK